MITDSTYTYTYSYDPSRPHAVISTGTTGDKQYIYDANGNMTFNPNTSMNFTWDDENRLTSTVDSSQKKIVYTYDDTGKRIIKSAPGNEVIYVNDNYAVRNGEVQSKHIFAGNTRVATKITANKDTGTYYYHGDHLGSSNIVTDSNGGFYEHLEYFPFGETWVDEQAKTYKDTVPYKFTSKEQDETGLYYFGARYYDPKLSRWISADKAVGKFLPNKNTNESLPGIGGVYNFKNLDTFNYSHNNPLIYKDPDGNYTGFMDLGITDPLTQFNDIITNVGCTMGGGFHDGVSALYGGASNTWWDKNNPGEAYKSIYSFAQTGGTLWSLGMGAMMTGGILYDMGVFNSLSNFYYSNGGVINSFITNIIEGMTNSNQANFGYMTDVANFLWGLGGFGIGYLTGSDYVFDAIPNTINWCGFPSDWGFE